MSEKDEPDQIPTVRPTPLDDMSQRPLSETIQSAITGAPDRVPLHLPLESLDDPMEGTHPGIRRSDLASFVGPVDEGSPHVALGETLQLVRYARRGDTLLISGITPHGRRLTFEQREDRQGWYVVAAGRRRRPSQRELGLVVATITQEMEAAIVPERQAEVRSAYRLAVASDQPGMAVPGLEAYRDVLLDEASAFISGETERLTVVAVEYQAFKRFAIRHGHRIGAAFVQALGERLSKLFHGVPRLQVFHKAGKAFRLIAVDYTASEVDELVARIPTEETAEWIVRRVWGDERRTHADEISFHIGIAAAFPTERDSDYAALAQRLSDDAHRAGKIGQLLGHTSLSIAKNVYRNTIYRWNRSSEDDLDELATSMDDGPAEVNAEMSDYLHELVPADVEGMAVAGDLHALVYCAIAREGFWQGTTAMRIAGERLLARFTEGAAPEEGERDFVGGFDLGDEFYGILFEGDRFFFARGDINGAGATRVRAGLERVQHAVGWRRDDGGGVVGRFIEALEPGEASVYDRIRDAARRSFDENFADPRLHVNDAVDIADFLVNAEGAPATGEDTVEGAELKLVLPGGEVHEVKVLSRRSGFALRLSIDGEEYPAAVSPADEALQVRLRIRQTVASAAIAIVSVERDELEMLLAEVREDNHLDDEHAMDVIGFLRHLSDILLENHVKLPAKIRMALGLPYSAERFVQAYTIEEIREIHPGLFYEALHQDLLTDTPAADLDKQLVKIIGRTMLRSSRPTPPRASDKPATR